MESPNDGRHQIRRIYRIVKMPMRMLEGITTIQAITQSAPMNFTHGAKYDSETFRSIAVQWW